MIHDPLCTHVTNDFDGQCSCALIALIRQQERQAAAVEHQSPGYDPNAKDNRP